MRITFICGLCLSLSSTAIAQVPTSVAIADTVANRVQRFASLTSVERDSVFAINMRLHAQKTAARETIVDKEQLRSAIQVVENSRDSLYQSRMRPACFLIYRQNKLIILSGR